MKILAISGSLRSGSTSAKLIRAAMRVAPEGMQIELYEGLGLLPHFNPDLDGEGTIPPPPVADLRELVANANGLIIATPEYAHGVPGALKNGLDWLVSGVEILEKPVLLMNASPGTAEFAQAALAETLRTMSARIVVEKSLLEPLARTRMDPAGNVLDPALDEALRSGLSLLSSAASQPAE